MACPSSVFCVDEGEGLCDLFFTMNAGVDPWIADVAHPAIIYGEFAAEIGGAGYFAEFSPAVATAAPEPGTLTLTLTGVGLAGLMVAMRKRIAQGLPPATMAHLHFSPQISYGRIAG